MRGKSNNRFKLTAKEKGWILYDVGNSAFVLMVSTILPIYFNYLAENAGISDVDYLAYWGYAASIVTLIVAVLGPVLGTLADTKGFKKPIFTGCVVAGCLSCIAMGVTSWWISFLVVFIIAKVCFHQVLYFMIRCCQMLQLMKEWILYRQMDTLTDMQEAVFHLL